MKKESKISDMNVVMFDIGDVKPYGNNPRIIEPSKAYLQNQGKYSPQIALLTKVDGTMVVSEAVPNTKKKTIQITTAYFTKRKVSDIHL